MIACVRLLLFFAEKHAKRETVTLIGTLIFQRAFETQEYCKLSVAFDWRFCTLRSRNKERASEGNLARLSAIGKMDGTLFSLSSVLSVALLCKH